MNAFKFIWICYNISLIFIIVIPGVGATFQTPLALLLILQNFFSFPLERKYFGIVRLLLFVMAAILFSAFLGNNLNLFYANFVLWIINAIAFIKTMSNPYYRSLAIKVWAYTILVFSIYRFLTLFGFPTIPTMSHQKNGIGIILAVFMPVALVYFRNKWKNNQFWLLYFFFAVLMIINASRSSILAFVLVSLLLIYLIEVKMLNKYHYLLIIPFSIGVLLIFLPFLRSQNQTLDTRLSDVENMFSSEYDVRDVEASTFSIRYLLIEKAIHLIKKYPFYGVGLTNFQDYHGTKFDYFFRYERKKKGNLNAHNSYLAILSETGLIGFIPFCLLLLTVIGRIIKVLLVQKNYTNLEYLMGMGMAIGILIEMFFVYNIVSISAWTYLIAIFPLTSSKA